MAPATSIPTQESTDTRALLLEAAITYMALSGPAVNFDTIAAEAGFTKGALYHHFGSVDGLVEAVFKEAVRRHAEQVIAASEEGTGRERLRGLVESSARLYGSGTPFYQLLLRLHVEAGVNRPSLASIAKKVQRRQRHYMTELVEEGQEDGSIRADLDPVAVGEMVNATLQGLLVQQLEPERVQRRSALRFGELLEEIL
ncbi:MAG: TetR/AcrR family transcriptional regulator [Solirubrobacterales bacterium]